MKRITLLIALTFIFGNISLTSYAKKRTTSINSRFIKAIEHGDVKKVRRLLASGANVNTRGSGKTTPLIISSNNGYIEIVKMLLAHKADIDAVNIDGENALMLTSSGMLFGKKEKIHFQIAELLVKRGIKLETKNKKGGIKKLLIY